MNPDIRPMCPGGTEKVDSLSLTETQWSTLLDAIRSKKCTPFIGAGACFGLMPLASKLAEELLEQEEKETHSKCPLMPASRSDLAAVAQYISVRHHSAPFCKRKIASVIRSHYPRDADFDAYLSDEFELHRVLADLRLPLYLTTNYDDCMVRALRRCGIKVLREYGSKPLGYYFNWVCSSLKELPPESS